MEAFESGFQGSYEADLALIIINLKGLGIKNEVIARPPFDFYLARKSNFWSNFEYHYVFWCLAYISNCTLYGWPSWEPKSANRNLVKTPITTISSDECLTSYGDTSVLVDKICTKKINDQECPVSLEKDQNEIKKIKYKALFSERPIHIIGLSWCFWNWKGILSGHISQWSGLLWFWANSCTLYKCT